MIIIIIMIPCYKNGKSMITVACYKSDDDNKFNNNENKICLLLRRWVWWIAC